MILDEPFQWIPEKKESAPRTPFVILGLSYVPSPSLDLFFTFFFFFSLFFVIKRLTK